MQVLFLFPLVLGRARNGRDTMEPFEPSLFLLGFTSPRPRSLCFWFDRRAGPVPEKPGVNFVSLWTRGSGEDCEPC